MAAADNKAIVRRFYDEAFNKGRIDVLDEVCAKDVVDRNPMPNQKAGVQGVRENMQMWRTAFPDAKITVDSMIAEGDTVVACFTATGTHRGALMGIQPTHRAATLTWIDCVTLRDGKIFDWRHNEDLLGMLAQLGLVDVEAIFAGRGQSTGATGGQPKPSEARAKQR